MAVVDLSTWSLTSMYHNEGSIFNYKSEHKLLQIGRSSVIEVKDAEYDIDKTLQIPYLFTDMQRLKFVAYMIPGEEEEATDPLEEGVAITSVALVSSFYSAM